jgi:hypothetical protein
MIDDRCFSIVQVAPFEELRKDVKWDALFGRDPDPLAGIGDEIKAEYFRGHRNKVSPISYLTRSPKDPLR